MSGVNLVNRLGALAVAGIIGSAVISGCGSSPAPAAPAAAASSGSSADSTPAAPASVAQMQFPISAYRLTTLQSTQEQYLSQRLTQLCVRSFGFDFLPGLSSSTIADHVRIIDELNTRLFGISDATAARTYGYHLPTWTNGRQPPQLIAQLPRAERTVLIGHGATSYHGKAIPVGGCMSQAASELARAGVSAGAPGSGSPGSAALPGSIDMRAFESAQSDPRVRAVFARWASCMRTYGYHYATPFDAGGDPRWTSASTASHAEIRTARRDIACKLRVNLLGVEYAVMSGYETRAITRNARALAPVKAGLAAEQAAISKLMSRYGG